MMGTNTIIISVIVVAAATAALTEVDDDWTTFKKIYKKMYASEEDENFRKAIFYENQLTIQIHNEKYDSGVFSYKLKMNQFGDMSFSEYDKFMHETNKTKKLKHEIRGKVFVQHQKVKIPDFIDWREKGAVTPVRDQGLACGSCWAFSATGALEGQYFKKTGVLTSLSAQCLIDCTEDYGNLGCQGGSTHASFQFARDHRGIANESSYGYEGKEKECAYLAPCRRRVKTSHIRIEQADEDALKEAVATVGPVSAMLDGGQNTFRFYSEGIYFQPLCNKDDMNHAVLIVGYGTDNSTNSSMNQDYWLVKNSFGKTWGENGFFKIARNKDDHCGIASWAAYPIV